MGIAWLRERVRPTPAPWLGALAHAGFSAAGVALGIAFGALRNIPITPFSWFTP